MQSQERDVEKATGELVTRIFTKAGISVDLPQDVFRVRVETGRQWQDLYGCKTITFILARVSMAQYNRGDLNPIAGHVNVYSPEQYAHWVETPSAILEGGELIFRNGKASWSREDEQFDRLQVHEGVKNAWGLTQTTYRIDRRAPDGRVFQAMVTRMDYTEDLGVQERDTALITNILQSVQFIEPRQ